MKDVCVLEKLLAKKRVESIKRKYFPSIVNTHGSTPAKTRVCPIWKKAPLASVRGVSV